MSGATVLSTAVVRGLAKTGKHFRTSERQAFAGTNVNRYAFPSPGIDLQAYRSERLDGRACGDSLFVQVSAELAPDKVASS